MRTSRHTWVIRSSSDFGRTIADLRTLRDVTQDELASQTGLPREYLARLERGLTATMLSRVLRLLRRLGAEITVTVADGEDDA